LGRATISVLQEIKKIKNLISNLFPLHPQYKPVQIAKGVGHNLRRVVVTTKVVIVVVLKEGRIRERRIANVGTILVVVLSTKGHGEGGLGPERRASICTCSAVRFNCCVPPFPVSRLLELDLR